MGQEQERRKRVLRELCSLLSGYSAACSLIKDPEVEDVTDTDLIKDSEVEDVTDTEWFFLVSMPMSFPTGSGLPGNALLAARPIWITTALSDAPCERARQGHIFGLRTMVCVPIGTGVLELASTEFIFQTTESIPRILSLFNQGATELVD
jgi:transcription factor MYC2